MGQNQAKKVAKMAAVAIPEETLETYIRSEFRAMDTDRDGKLNRQQVLDLITLLGCSKGKDALRHLHKKSEEEVEIEEYVAAMKKEKSLMKETSRFRQWFAYFDKDKSGSATKEEIISGLEEADVKVDKELQKTVEQMDANHDGKITYEEFCVTQFRISLEEKTKKNTK